MTFCSEKNFCLDRIELHSYVLIVKAIYYGQIHSAFVVKEDIFYLDILLYKSFARIYLSVTKSVFQAK